MPQIDEAALKKQIKEGTLSRVYLLYGEEPYLVKQYAQKITEKAVAGNFPDFNFQQFTGDASVDQINEAVEALPMMSERKCVLVKDYNAEGANAAETAKMEQLLADPPESCVLIFQLSAVAADTKKSAKWRSFIKAVAKVGSAIELPRRDTAALVKYLSAFAQKRGCAIASGAARYLLTQCTTELTVLHNEMEKLCAFVQDGEITKETIDTVSVRMAQTVSFRLANALAARDFDLAYRLLDTLLFQREEPIAILAAISSAYVDLYRARAALESGENAMELTKVFEYRGLDFKMKNAMNSCRKYSLDQLRDCLESLTKADRALKGSRMQPRVILERTIAELLLISAKR